MTLQADLQRPGVGQQWRKESEDRDGAPSGSRGHTGVTARAHTHTRQQGSSAAFRSSGNGATGDIFTVRLQSDSSASVSVSLFTGSSELTRTGSDRVGSVNAVRMNFDGRFNTREGTTGSTPATGPAPGLVQLVTWCSGLVKVTFLISKSNYFLLLQTSINHSTGRDQRVCACVCRVNEYGFSSLLARCVSCLTDR